MPVVSRLRPPVELLHMILSLAGQADLSALARVDKLCNDICTPLLYWAIDIYDYDTGLLCVRSLAADPSSNFSGRNLASLVHTFRLHDSLQEAAPTQLPPMFDELLADSVVRMSNIMELRCMEARLCALEIWVRLLRKRRRFLRSVELPLLKHFEARSIPQHLEEAFQLLARSRRIFPKLTKLNVYAPMPLSPSMIAVVRGIITASRRTLHTLSFTTLDPQLFQLAIPALDALPALRRLEVEVQTLVTRRFGMGSQVRALCVRESFWPMGSTIALSPTQWPAVEELACFPSMVPAFLPPDAEVRRPISTLRLAFAVYQHNGCEYSRDVTPFWSDNLLALSHTAYSAVPLKHFGVQVDTLNIPRFQGFLPYLQHVESLVMVITTCPISEDILALGETIIARLPRLRALLLSDAAFKGGGQNCAFRFARDLALQRSWLAEFERCSSALRHVAFTTEFEWEKVADRTWYPTELPRSRPVDEDEDSNNNLEDGYNDA